MFRYICRSFRLFSKGPSIEVEAFECVKDGGCVKACRRGTVTTKQAFKTSRLQNTAVYELTGMVMVYVCRCV